MSQLLVAVEPSVLRSGGMVSWWLAPCLSLIKLHQVLAPTPGPQSFLFKSSWCLRLAHLQAATTRLQTALCSALLCRVGCRLYLSQAACLASAAALQRKPNQAGSPDLERYSCVKKF